MRKGIVNYLDPNSGVGYILDENEQEITFDPHYLDESIKIGTFVAFEIELDTNGLVAKNIKVLI